ncbi:MAG: TIGR03084 family metal-binding protein [Acidimicrobiia bacterium]
MTTVREVASDLRTEQEALDAIVAGLADEQWGLPTPSPGWTVADQIGHLTYFDGAAATAITDPDAFAASVGELLASPAEVDARTLHRHLRPRELLAAWRDGRERLARAAETLGDDTRVAWYGPSMGARSFLTARLMECWAHGHDVADAVGAELPATGRLRHVARLGVMTRAWSYANRGIEVPAGDVRVELTGPAGERWEFGPEDAGEAVTGPALDFCLVVTQRRHVDDTRLRVTGEVARDWLVRAQAFAGPPTDGPAARSRA